MPLSTFFASGIWICLGIVFTMITYDLIKTNVDGRSLKYRIKHLLSYLVTMLLSGFFFGMAMWIVYLG